MKKNSFIVIYFLSIVLLPAYAQKKPDKINDFNTPLHLLQADYDVPYGVPDKREIKNNLDRILTYLESVTPASIIDNETGKEIKNISDIHRNSVLKKEDFRIASYEWGVTYAAMLAAAEATGDRRYENYVYDRFHFLSSITSGFKKQMNDYGTIDPQIHQILVPKALDDAGAMCTAMLKANRKNSELELEPMIRNYMNYIMYNEYRLYDGTFARKRPQMNTVWLDDMFMSIPALAQMGAFSGENRYFDEAARQIALFSDKMFVKEKGLFRHGWVESMDDHPSFFWGRANGWALLTFVETLQTTAAPIFSVGDATRPDQIAAGSTRKRKSNPVVFLIGDSTVKNGRGSGYTSVRQKPAGQYLSYCRTLPEIHGKEKEYNETMKRTENGQKKLQNRKESILST
jgi:Predicted unsaturated glucuronyl hydrolase involved in regulation of bacterial surface properties, and related proteins